MERMWRKVNQGLISKPSASGKIRGGGTTGHHHQSVAAMLAAQESAAAAGTGGTASAGPIVSFANDYPSSGSHQPRSSAGAASRMSRSSRRSHQATGDLGDSMVGEQYSLQVRPHPANASSAVLTNGSSGGASTESRRRRRRKSKSRCNKNNRWVVSIIDFEESTRCCYSIEYAFVDEIIYCK